MTIDVNNLTFSYEKTPVLSGVSFSVKQGEFIVLFGPNGGGKTTLLKLLIGLLSPDQGTVTLMGVEPCQVRDKVGYVPQARQFDPLFPITTLDVVCQGLFQKHPYHFGKKAREKALVALENVGLSGKEKAPFGSLSGGQRQRALFARATIESPEILLLDEATAGVDASAEKQIFDHLTTTCKGKTIILVTHDLESIVQKADRLFCINQNATSYAPKEVCGHFALGLYHKEKKDD